MNRQDVKDEKEPSEELDRLARRVIGAAIEVHRHLGPGLLESIYESALSAELDLRGIRSRRQVPLPVRYKGRDIGESRLDLIVENELVVEIKAATALLPVHVAQVLSYLKVGRFQLGILINFNVTVLREAIRRVIRNPTEPWRLRRLGGSPRI